MVNTIIYYEYEMYIKTIVWDNVIVQINVELKLSFDLSSKEVVARKSCFSLLPFSFFQLLFLLAASDANLCKGIKNEHDNTCCCTVNYSEPML